MKSENLKLIEVLQPLIDMVNAQAEDAGLWFKAQWASEAYLQRELRKLHAEIERVYKEYGE